jgi:hypothetical protein
MIELKEKFLTPAEARKQSKDSLIEHIFELTFQKAREKSKGATPTDVEIKEEFWLIMDQYKKSETVKEMLGIDDYQDWDSFFDEVSNKLIRKLSGKKSERGVPPTVETSEVTGRKLYRGERNMLNILLGKAFTILHEKHLTTEDYDFERVMKEIINKILDDHEVEKITDESGREQIRREMTAAIYKSFAPKALEEYEVKRKMKGKKYSPGERNMLLQIIEETLERVSIIMENKNLDADANLKTSEKMIPSGFSKKDIEKVRRLIKSALAKALTKNSVNSESQENYIKDLTPLILESLNKKPPNPTETILENLYKK